MMYKFFICYKKLMIYFFRKNFLQIKYQISIVIVMFLIFWEKIKKKTVEKQKILCNNIPRYSYNNKNKTQYIVFVEG